MTSLFLLGAVPAFQEPRRYEVYAVSYGVLPDFPVSSLVAGADPTRRLDIQLMVWVLKGSGRTILIDSGFHRAKHVERWKPRHHVPPSEAVRKLGIEAADVTDVIVTHMHWDHAGGLDLFPKAVVWIQKEEYFYYTGPAWQEGGRRGGIDAEDVQVLVRLHTEGRVRWVDGDDQEFLPGVRGYTGGRHTHESQFIAVETETGTVVLASDNLYLYENLEKGVPIAQTLDRESNLRAQRRMKMLASRPDLVVPGHDPAVLTRFPNPAPGVAHIR